MPDKAASDSQRDDCNLSSRSSTAEDNEKPVVVYYFQKYNLNAMILASNC